jgi:predicted RNA-binding protein YlqC (UPF0109 family)
MQVDNKNGESSAAPLVEPVPEDGYGDDYPDDDEGDAEYDEANDLHAPPTAAAERLRGLVAYLATNLIDDPASVEVEARQRGGSVFISLRVPEEELGKVIGRGGRIARAMRTALMIAGSRNNVRASLDIED